MGRDQQDAGLDGLVFDRLLETQADSPSGHLVALGCSPGRSAVIGGHRRQGERFVVVDPVGGTDEQDHRARRGDLPEVVGPRSTVADQLPAGSVRFLHVGASDRYEVVRQDAQSARTLLRPGGLVAFDDFRSEHTPGTAAALWESVANDGLVPVALTADTLYAVFSDPEPYRAAIERLTTDDDGISVERHHVAGHCLIRIGESPVAEEPSRAKRAAETTEEAPRPPAEPSATVRTDAPAVQPELAEMAKRLAGLEKLVRDRSSQLDEVARRSAKLERRIERASATFPLRTALSIRRRLYRMLK